jgi:hypothetical protein
MKKFFCTLGIGIAVWALPGAATVHAADMESQRISVPFAFKVNKTTLPAGHYRVEQFQGKRVVFIVNLDTGHRIPVIRDNNDPIGTRTLTFEKVGNEYKLTKVS